MMKAFLNNGCGRKEMNMRIVKSDVLLNEEKIPVLVKESAVNYKDLEAITSAAEVTQIMADVFLLDRQLAEVIYLIAFNNRGKPLGFFQINKGFIDKCPVDVRGMMVRLLLCNASSHVLVHNHTSGEVTPSQDDFLVTERIRQASEVLGLNFLDHIIIGEKKHYFSFRESVWQENRTGEKVKIP